MFDNVGLRGHHRELPDMTDAYQAKHAAFAACDLELLEAASQKLGGVPKEEKASVDTLKYSLEQVVATAKYSTHRYALDQMNGFHTFFYMMVSQTPVRNIS